MSGHTPSPSSVSSDSKCKEITWEKKLGFSAIGGLIFILVSLPPVYKLVDKLFELILSNGIIADPNTGAPTYWGIIVHAIVFTLLVFLTMEPWKEERMNA